MSKIKKIVEEAKENGGKEIDLIDRGISSFAEIPGLCENPEYKNNHLL